MHRSSVVVGRRSAHLRPSKAYSTAQDAPHERAPEPPTRQRRMASLGGIEIPKYTPAPVISLQALASGSGFSSKLAQNHVKTTPQPVVETQTTTEIPLRGVAEAVTAVAASSEPESAQVAPAVAVSSEAAPSAPVETRPARVSPAILARQDYVNRMKAHQARLSQPSPSVLARQEHVARIKAREANVVNMASASSEAAPIAPVRAGPTQARQEFMMANEAKFKAQMTGPRLEPRVQNVSLEIPPHMQSNHQFDETRRRESPRPQSQPGYFQAQQHGFQQSSPPPRGSRAARLHNTDFALNDPRASTVPAPSRPYQFDNRERSAINQFSRAQPRSGFGASTRGRGGAAGRGRGGAAGRGRGGAGRIGAQGGLPKEGEGQDDSHSKFAGQVPAIIKRFELPKTISEETLAAYQGNQELFVKHLEALRAEALDQELESMMTTGALATDLGALFGTSTPKPVEAPSRLLRRSVEPVVKELPELGKYLKTTYTQRAKAKRRAFLKERRGAKPVTDETMQPHLPYSKLVLAPPPKMQKLLAQPALAEKFSRMYVQTAREAFGGDYSRFALSPMAKRNKSVGPALSTAHRLLGRMRVNPSEKHKALSLISSIAPYDTIRTTEQPRA